MINVAVDGANLDVDDVDRDLWWDGRSVTVRGTVRLGEFTATGSTGPAASFMNGVFYIGEITPPRPQALPGQLPILGHLATTHYQPGSISTASGVNMGGTTSTFDDDAGRAWRSMAFPQGLGNGAAVEVGGDVVAAVGGILVAGAGAVANGGDVVAAVGAVVVSAAGSFSLGGDVVVVSGAAVVSGAGAAAQGDDSPAGVAAIIVDGVVFSLQGDDVVFAEASTGSQHIDVSPVIVLVTSPRALAAVTSSAASAAVSGAAGGAVFVIASRGATVSVVPNAATLEVIP